MSIREAAEILLSDYLKKGSLAAVPAKNLPGTFFHGEEGRLDEFEERDFSEELGFAVSGIQAIGYEEGNDDPKIHIYTSAGRRVLKGTISIRNHSYNVETTRLGKMVVNPALSGAHPAGEIYRKNDRIACGSSVAPARENYSGTLGALVDINGTMYALSNNHVFSACNHVEKGMPIMSPSNSDSRQGFPPIDFSIHDQFIPLLSGDPSLMPPCEVDIAIAQITEQDKVSSWQGDDINGYDTPRTTTRPYTGLLVKKFGRTTGFTQGVLECKTLPQAISYKSNRFNGIVWFTDFWTVVSTDPAEPFALPGDSGSLVVTADGQNAVGLIFAGADATGIAFIIPFAKVVTHFPGLSLIQAHNI